MEQNQTSSDQGGQRRRASRRRRRRRRRSAATGPGPAAAANSAPRASGRAAPAAAKVHAPAPPPAAAAAPAAATAAEPRADARTCPLCAKTVQDLYTAIAYGERNAPAHFDCIVSLLGEREELEQGARLCYLGGGSFGIVQMRPAARPGDRTLLIHKRIEVEEKDAAPAWREELRLSLQERRITVAANEAAPCK